MCKHYGIKKLSLCKTCYNLKRTNELRYPRKPQSDISSYLGNVDKANY